MAIKATNEGLGVMENYVSKIVEQRELVLEKLLSLKYVGRNIGGLDSNFILIEILIKTVNHQMMLLKIIQHLGYRQLGSG